MPLKKLAKALLRETPHPILDDLSSRSGDAAASALYDGIVEGSFLLDDEAYVRGRFLDAVRERGVIEKTVGVAALSRAKILDVAAGNGAFELALISAGYLVVSVETLWNPLVVRMRNHGVPVRRVIADAAALPFREDVFDVISIHDAVEHFRKPRTIGRSIVRVLKPGGRIFVTTPARLRFLLRRDPHYGIRFLVALPDVVQQRIVRRRGYTDLHHTERIYWSAGGIRRLFPATTLDRVLSRWKVMRSLLFDEIVLRKPI